MPQAISTPINWHLSPIAQRIIARLDESNTHSARRVSIPADFYERAGNDRFAIDAITALDLIREVSIDEAVGYSFYDVCQRHNWDEAKAKAWQAAADRAPNVTQVLEEAFADCKPVKVAA